MDVFLENDVENKIGETLDQRGSFNDNSNKKQSCNLEWKREYLASWDT